LADESLQNAEIMLVFGSGSSSFLCPHLLLPKETELVKDEGGKRQKNPRSKKCPDAKSMG
jgi:hypothetical protein